MKTFVTNPLSSRLSDYQEPRHSKRRNSEFCFELEEILECKANSSSGELTPKLNDLFLTSRDIYVGAQKCRCGIEFPASIIRGSK